MEDLTEEQKKYKKIFDLKKKQTIMFNIAGAKKNTASQPASQGKKRDEQKPHSESELESDEEEEEEEFVAPEILLR